MRRILVCLLFAFLALVPIYPALAAITLSQNGTAGGNVPSVTGKNTTGDTLFVACILADNSQGAGQTVTDNKGNSWTRLVRVPALASNQIEMWYSLPTTVGASTNFTYSGNFSTIDVLTFQGTATSSGLDGAVTSTSGTFTTTSSPGSITASQNGDVFVSCLGLDNNAAAVAINSSFNILNNVGAAGGSIASAYFIQTSAGALNPQWSNWTSTNSLSSMQAFKDPSSPASSTPSHMTLLGVGP